MPKGHDKMEEEKSQHSISSEGKLDQNFLFDSALEVGSKFIKVEPDNEIVFTQVDGVFTAEFSILNTTKNATVAYYVRSPAHCSGLDC